MEKITTTEWKSTKQIAEILGISRDKVLQWIRSGVFQAGVHYRDISFDKNRPTYRFDLEKINQLFEGQEHGCTSDFFRD